jgi:hypothetical protein
MKFGILRYDDDGHIYLIPEELVDRFDISLDNINSSEFMSDKWYDFVNRFSDKFSQYMVDGSKNFKVIIEE